MKKACTLILAVFLAWGLQGQQRSITIAVGNELVRKGDEVCVPVSVASFQNMLSTQYTLQWDPAVLQYQGVRNFQLPFLTADNFGTQLAKEGKLTIVWIDNSLNGVQRADGTSIYEVCFTAKGKAGSATPLALTQDPTPFEAVDTREELIQINGVGGSVRVQ